MAESTTQTSVAFFAFAKSKTSLSPEKLRDYLQKAADYCHLKRPLLGMTEVKEVHRILKTVAEGKLLRIKFGKDAQKIRNATQLYYEFIRDYQKPTYVSPTKEMLSPKMDDSQDNQLLFVDLRGTQSYDFTKPVSYTYRGAKHLATSWSMLFVEVCGHIFGDYREQFMNLMNGDLPGYHALIFADEYHKEQMRSPKSFSKGYYVETNLSATTLVSKIRGLCEFFHIPENDLVIGYYSKKQPTKEKPKPAAKAEKISVSEENTLLSDYRRFLLEKQLLAERTADNYCKALHVVEDFIQQHNLKHYVFACTADEMQRTIDILMSRPDFDKIDKAKHRQLLAAMKQYLMFLRGEHKIKPAFVQSRSMTIKEAVIRVLSIEGKPLNVPEILQKIQEQDLYAFNSQNPQLMVYDAIRKSCQGMKLRSHTKDDAFIRVETGEKPPRFFLLNDKSAKTMDVKVQKDGENLCNQILQVVADIFPNGIRPASIIDLKKLKRCYSSRFQREIPESTEITVILKDNGIQNGDKVYILTDDQKQSLKNLIVQIFASGHRVIYYSELLYHHSDLLESCHLLNEPLMRVAFGSLLPQAVCKEEYMLSNEDANDVEEITRAFGEDLVLTCQQLKARCPYLTLNAIKSALSRSSRFVWSSTETYAQTDLVQLAPEEVNRIKQTVINQIQTDGYYSLAKLPLEESCSLNPGVSVSAVRDAMFIRLLAERCDRSGLIATPKGVRASSAQLLEGWCKSQEQFTITELEAYEYELTGHHAVLGIAAACKSMVRIDQEHFVCDALIDFDVESVDHAIALFVMDRIIPITAITSFTSFPEVPGYTWNLYLVESFLRRFSRRFTIDGGPAKMSFVGGICPVYMTFENYEDRLAHAVVQDRVPMTEDSVGRYLTEKKYILRRSDSVRKILTMARILSDQRGDSDVWL